MPTAEQVQDADGLTSNEMNAVYACISGEPWCAHYCYGDEEPMTAAD